MEMFIERASSFAGEIDSLIVFIAVVAGFWFVVAEIVLFWFIFKFRKKNNPKAQYITGEKHKEKKWIHWPHNLVLVCDVLIIIFAVKVWYNVKQTLPKADVTIRVVGQQWAWKFTHPGVDGVLDTEDDIRTVDDLNVKVNTTYHYKLESEDVMHSFSVPVFRLKQDAVPGRIITGWFKPTKVGDYDIQCAEMCGIGHGVMGARIHVQSDSDHAAWIIKNTQKKHIVNKKTNKVESI